MKKIVISAVVTPNDDSVTLKNLEDALRHLGVVYFPFSEEFEMASSEGLTKEIWLYISSDDEAPYVRVNGPDETEGEDISAELADEYRTNGVCVEFQAKYPRAERHGAPLSAHNNDFAAGVVGSHNFRVSIENFTVGAEDSRDDTAEQIWLKIALPA